MKSQLLADFFVFRIRIFCRCSNLAFLIISLMKRFFFLCCLLLLASGLFAQSKSYIGVKGGYNIGSAFIKHSLNRVTVKEGFKSGFHVGLTTVHYLEKHVGLQAELNYTKKGWIQKFDSGEKFIQDLNYVELPILVNVYFGSRKTRPFINVGTFIEYLVSDSNNGLPIDTTGSDFYYFQAERDKKFGYGLTAGGGFYQDIGSGTIVIEGRFTFNNSNVFESGTLDSGIPNVSNQINTTISIGYLLSFGNGFD